MVQRITLPYWHYFSKIEPHETYKSLIKINIKQNKIYLLLIFKIMYRNSIVYVSEVNMVNAIFFKSPSALL
jgi:hypothetical protein